VQAVRFKQPDAAMAAWSAAVAAGVPLQTASHNAALYLATGLEAWDLHVRALVPSPFHPASGPPGAASTSGRGGEAAGAAATGAPWPTAPLPKPPPPPGSAADASAASTAAAAPDAVDEAGGGSSAADAAAVAGGLADADRVWAHMQRQAGLRPDEVTYTQLARLAALRGDLPGCLAVCRTIRDAGMPLRLRAFHPALVLCAHGGDAGGAARLLADIGAAGLDLSEPEYGLALEALAKGGAYEQFAGARAR
jgi:hypothetical protein